MTKGYSNTIKNRLEKLQQSLALEFDLDKLSKSPARFNQTKLDWFNKEYIKLLSLEEFVFRCQTNRLIQTFPENKLRIGDYVYLVDLEEQKVFIEDTKTLYPSSDGVYHPLGGGREKSETWSENVVREVFEETENQINIDPTKLKLITQFQIPTQPQTYHNQTWEGKEFHVYFYELNIDQITSSNGDGFPCRWVDLVDVLETNRFLTYAIWKDFCIQNDLQFPKPSQKVLRNYLAAVLDKNRITKLSDFGLESDCINNYQTPVLEAITWKKSDTATSIKNLKEIKAYINELFDKNDYAIPDKIEDLEAFFANTVLDLETQTKQWLTNNNYDLGSYLWPLRVTLSGSQKSPSPFELLSCLTITEINRRIDAITDQKT